MDFVRVMLGSFVGGCFCQCGLFYETCQMVFLMRRSYGVKVFFCDLRLKKKKPIAIKCIGFYEKGKDYENNTNQHSERTI